MSEKQSGIMNIMKECLVMVPFTEPAAAAKVRTNLAEYLEKGIVK